MEFSLLTTLCADVPTVRTYIRVLHTTDIYTYVNVYTRVISFTPTIAEHFSLNLISQYSDMDIVIFATRVERKLTINQRNSFVLFRRDREIVDSNRVVERHGCSTMYVNIVESMSRVWNCTIHLDDPGATRAQFKSSKFNFRQWNRKNRKHILERSRFINQVVTIRSFERRN